MSVLKGLYKAISLVGGCFLGLFILPFFVLFLGVRSIYRTIRRQMGLPTPGSPAPTAKPDGPAQNT